jgi:adenylate cyclase
MSYFRNILFIILLLFSCCILGQTTDTVGLQERLDTLSEEGKAKEYNDLSYGFLDMNPDLAIEYGISAFKIARENDIKSQEALALFNIGCGYESSGLYKKAVEYYLSSYSVYAAINDTSGKASTLNYIGYVYKSWGNYEMAIAYFTKSLSEYEKLDDKVGMSYLLNNMGVIYYRNENYVKALEYYQKALEELSFTDDKLYSGNTLMNIGLIYYETGHYEEALEYYEKSREIFLELNDEAPLSSVYNNIAQLYLKLGRNTLAIEYAENAMKLKEYKNDFEGMAISLVTLGTIYKTMGNNTLALEYFNKAYKICADNAFNSEMIKVCLNISETYSEFNDFENAYKYHELYSAYSDSVYTEEKFKLTAELQTQFETEKKEQEIKLKDTENEKLKYKITQQNTLRYALVTGILLLMALVFVSYYSYRRKKKDNIEITYEKNRSEKLLLNILPSEIAEELKTNGSAKARKYDMVTVLFADFKGFTMFAEQHSPEVVVTEIDNCFRAFDDIMNRYDIEKIKTIGDSYMCAGGIPVINSSNPVDVVKCGLEMIDFMNNYKSPVAENNIPVFEVRIGVHTGPVVAGIVGLKKFAYDIWGDTVNTASRMETSGEVGRVNISGETYNYVKDYFKCEYRGKIVAKNKGEIDMYFVNSVI